MNNIHLILLLVIISYTQADIVLKKADRCECSSFIKTECDKWFDCKWTTACQDKECADYTTEDKCTNECVWKGAKCTDGKKVCADMPTEESCSNMSGCGWKDNKCITFTQCSDFIVSKPERCNALRGQKDEQCQPKGVVVSTSTRKHLVTAAVGTQCENKVYVDCTKFPLESTCKGDATATAKCQWKSDNKCYAFELKACSDATGFKNLCDPKYCKLDGTNCVERTCADITTQAICTSFPKVGDTSYTLCKWGADNKCAAAPDTAFLTEQTCNDVTFGTYHWATTKCQQCGGWILSLFITLVLSLMF